ncbi:MAG TPA: amidohydrolase family protein, partial [Allosphingosinicella sp.]
MRLLAALALLLASAPAAAQPAPDSFTVIHAGTLLDRPGRAPRKNASILVRGGKIEAVQDGFVTPAGASIIDLRDRFVLPGLIDSHVHLGSDRAGNEGLIAGFTEPNQLRAYEAQWNAQKTLGAGF